MKTSEDWVAERAPSVHEYKFETLQKFVEEIQIDAFKAGQQDGLKIAMAIINTENETDWVCGDNAVTTTRKSLARLIKQKINES